MPNQGTQDRFTGEYPIPAEQRQAPRGVSEHVAQHDLRPPGIDEAAMIAAIDQIQDDLARNIPILQREMDELLARVRKPGLH